MIRAIVESEAMLTLLSGVLAQMLLSSCLTRLRHFRCFEANSIKRPANPEHLAVLPGGTEMSQSHIIPSIYFQHEGR